jgi:hypothetical protein
MEVETPVRLPYSKIVNSMRAVRFVLIEWLREDCMANIDANYFREEVRSIFLKKALHAEAIMRQLDVSHCYLCPATL